MAEARKRRAPDAFVQAHPELPDDLVLDALDSAGGDRRSTALGPMTLFRQGE